MVETYDGKLDVCPVCEEDGVEAELDSVGSVEYDEEGVVLENLECSNDPDHTFVEHWEDGEVVETIFEEVDEFT